MSHPTSTSAESPPSPPATVEVNRTVRLVAAYSWRLAVIAAVVVGVVWLTGRLLVVVVPVAVAALLARALSPLSARLRRAGWRPALAAVTVLAGFLVALAAVVGAVGVAVAGELGDLGPTLREGLDDVERWIVEDGPFDVSQADVDRWREQAGESLSSFVGSGQGGLASGALVAGEVLVGGLLALVVTFFMLKDGRRFVDGVIGKLRHDRRDVARRSGDRAWDAAGGYLRGAAVLGVVEGITIGVALLLVGGSLVVPVMVVTFLAAFVPIVGAIVAGVIAVLVALVTAGPTSALIVAGVAIVVQQLDNDLLAPVIYGRALQLHPLVVLLGIAAGGSLFGFVGTVFAVPVLAVAINVVDEVRHGRSPDAPVAVPHRP
jgi:predicted PurR-regulated permease PerM